VGTASASATYGGDANHLGSTGTGSFSIGQAASTTTVSCPAGPYTYDGTAHTPCSATVTGAGGLSLAPTPSYSGNTNAGTATASYTFSGDANHTGSSDSKTFTIGQASSTTVVSFEAGPYTYRGSAFTATVAVTGAGRLSLTPAPSYSGDCTNLTGPNGCTASYTWTPDANHTGSSDSKSITLTQATSTTTVSCPAGPYTYTGSAQTPCSATVTGVGGLSLTPTPSYSGNTNAGTATASHTFPGDANHTGSSDSKTFDITKAASVTAITVTNATYDGSPHGGTAMVTGVGGLNQSVTVNYAGVSPTSYGPSTTAPTDAGTYRLRGTFAGDDNHLGSQDAQTYTGSPQTPCSATATGAGGLNVAVAPVTYTNNTNVGTAGASATYAGDANHLGSTGTGGFTIDRAASAVTVTCTAGASYAYTGSAQTPCTAAATGAGGLNVGVTPVAYTSNTNVGTAGGSATYGGDVNHFGSTGTGSFAIGKAASYTVVTFEAAPYTYRGTAFTATAQVSGVGGLSAAVTPVVYTGDCANVTSANGC